MKQVFKQFLINILNFRFEIFNEEFQQSKEIYKYNRNKVIIRLKRKNELGWREIFSLNLFYFDVFFIIYYINLNNKTKDIFDIAILKLSILLTNITNKLNNYCS